MKPQELLESRLVRFLLGGGVTVVCEYVSFYILYIGLSWRLLLANSASFGVGLCVSYMFNRLWAFREQSYRRKLHHQIVLYVVLAATNLAINNVIVAGLKNTAGLDPRFGKVIAIIFIAAWNFIVYRKVIFIRAETEQPN